MNASQKRLCASTFLNTSYTLMRSCLKRLTATSISIIETNQLGTSTSDRTVVYEESLIGIAFQLITTNVVNHSLKKLGWQQVFLLMPCFSRYALAKLLTHWNREHGFAAYVSYTPQTLPIAYRYDTPLPVGEHTNFNKYLHALCSGAVIFDPGCKATQARTAQSKLRPEASSGSISSILSFCTKS